MHRILLFEGHWYAIYSYGFMLVTAMVAGLLVNLRRGVRAGLTKDQVLDLHLAIFLCGIVGARLALVIQDWDVYAPNPLQIFNIRAGGLSWHGSVIGGFVGFLWFAARQKMERGFLLDIITPGMIVGHIIGRLGCFLNGCCYGKPADVPWALTFPDAPELHFLPRHPTQLYEAGAELLVLGLLLLWFDKRPIRGGMFYAYLCLYAVERFVVDFFRHGQALAGGLNLAQYASFVLLAAGLIGLWRATKAKAA